MDGWEPEQRLSSRRSPPWLGGLIGILAVGTIGAIAWYMQDDIFRMFEKPSPNSAADAAVSAGDAAVELPLEQGDALVQKLGSEATSSKAIAGWLATPDIVRRLAAAVRRVADGESPRPVLSFLEVDGDFVVDEHVEGVARPRAKRGRNAKRTPVDVVEHIFVDPKSNARYDPIIRELSALDPDYVARTYKQLHPYFEAAFAEISRPGERFEAVLGKAIGRVLSVRVPEGPIELVPKGAIYAFKDPALEALSDAEKHVVRLGPANAKVLQDFLRRFSRASGIDSGR